MRCWLLRMVDQVVERSGLRTRRSRPSDNGAWLLGIGLGDFACEWLLIWLLVVSLTLTKQSSCTKAPPPESATAASVAA